jgi:pimeloyl-ACP methyl ester carboxylesterase
MNDGAVRLETHGAGESVLFLHGGGVGGWSWALQMEHLPEYHCIAPDLPGHGLRAATSAFTMRGAVEDASELIQSRARGGKAHVVGLSLGAQVGLQLVSDCPHLVRSAFLSGPLVLPRVSPVVLLEPLVLPLSSALLALYMPFRNLKPVLHANMWATNIPKRFERPFSEDVRLRSVSGLMQTLEEYGRFRLPKKLHDVDVPTLMLVGEREPPIMHDSARAVVQAFPKSRGYRVARMEHTWNLGHSGLFTATLRAWLGRAELPEALTPLEP